MLSAPKMIKHFSNWLFFSRAGFGGGGAEGRGEGSRGVDADAPQTCSTASRSLQLIYSAFTGRAGLVKCQIYELPFN